MRLLLALAVLASTVGSTAYALDLEQAYQQALKNDPQWATINNQYLSDSLKVEFVGIRIEVPSNVPMLLFKETGTSNYLPISIGMPEATSIMSVLQNQQKHN